MARVLVASLADDDMAAILTDIAREAGTSAALRYYHRFERLLDRLARHPAIGAPRPALGPDTRIGVVAPYVVIYDYDRDADAVMILRVMHGRRDRAIAALSKRQSP